MNNAAMNIFIQISVQVPTLSSFGYILRSGNSGSYVYSTFNFFLSLFSFDRERERERERESEHEWGRGRERETQNLKQAPGSEPSVQGPTRGSNSQTTRS